MKTTISDEKIDYAAQRYIDEEDDRYILSITPGAIESVVEDFKAGVNWVVSTFPVKLETQINDAAIAYAKSPLGEHVFLRADHSAHKEAYIKTFTRAAHWALDIIESEVTNG